MLRRSESNPDQGAVAVEFALLLPIFVTLTFGAFSGGLIYWHSISASQAVRDAARYGSTLPLTVVSPPATNTFLVGDWITATAQVALREAGVPDSDGDGTVESSEAAAIGAQLCVAFVAGSASTHTLATTSSTVGSGTGPATTAPCIANDGAPASTDRVQVTFQRDERFSTIFYSHDLTPRTRSVQPYQRVVK